LLRATGENRITAYVNAAYAVHDDSKSHSGVVVYVGNTLAYVVYQDCNAVVTLVTKGGSQTRTKHLRARMHLGKEMVDKGKVKVIYKRAGDMEADGFSKPYDHVKQKLFTKLMLGEKANAVNKWALNVRERSEEDLEGMS
jgi:hypothetical protein